MRDASENAKGQTYQDIPYVIIQKREYEVKDMRRKNNWKTAVLRFFTGLERRPAEEGPAMQEKTL